MFVCFFIFSRKTRKQINPSIYFIQRNNILNIITHHTSYILSIDQYYTYECTRSELCYCLIKASL